MPFWDRNTSNWLMKGQKQVVFFKGEDFITKPQIEHFHHGSCNPPSKNVFGHADAYIYLQMYVCRVHVGLFVCMSMSVSLSVPMPACPHLHFVRPGWRGAPVGKNNVHKSDTPDVQGSGPCHADAHVQTYVCIPVPARPCPNLRRARFWLAIPRPKCQKFCQIR